MVDCPRAQAFFARHTAESPETLQQSEATLAVRIRDWATRIKAAKAPAVLLGDVDVRSAQAAMAVADAINARVILDQSEQATRIQRTLARQGQVTCTFGELRSRADLVVMIGDDWADAAPRLKERFLPVDGQFLSQPREIIIVEPQSVNDLTQMLAAVRQALRQSDATLSIQTLAPTDQAIASQLIAACRTHATSAWLWRDAALGETPELPLQELLRLVEALNMEGRSFSLRMTDRPGLVTATDVCVWQTGLAPPLQFTSRGPEALEQYALTDFDLVIAVSPLGTLHHIAPDFVSSDRHLCVVPVACHGEYDQAIYVAVPGLHHPAHLQRGDGAMMQRIVGAASQSLPSASDVLTQLLKSLGR